MVVYCESFFVYSSEFYRGWDEWVWSYEPYRDGGKYYGYIADKTR